MILGDTRGMNNPIFKLFNIDYKDNNNIYKCNYINVIFEKIGMNHVLLNCLPNEKVSDLIQRYRERTKDNDNTNRFICHNKELNPSLSVEESNISNYDRIYVKGKNGGVCGGCCSMMFTDVSKNKTKEITFSKDAPSYRAISKGINIFGICRYKKCEAYKKEVVAIINKRKFDLIQEREELFCPECESLMSPRTVGFYLCKFRISGKKIEGKNEVSFQNMDDEANNKNSLKYFDPELSGETKMTELIFEVLEYL